MKNFFLQNQTATIKKKKKKIVKSIFPSPRCVFSSVRTLLFSRDNFARVRISNGDRQITQRDRLCVTSERDKYITGGLSLSMRIVVRGRVFYRENVYLGGTKARGTGRTGSIGRPLSGIGNKCRPDIEIWPIISRVGEGDFSPWGNNRFVSAGFWS